MLFSVLVPVYNVEKYLPECIDSVLSQTYQNFEIILVDDGSTDNSGTLCDEYADKYPFIKVFHKSNGGQLSARCWAIEKATGDWYVFLDSDDSLQPETLQVLYDKIQAYDCDCIIYKWQRVCDGKVLESIPTQEEPDKIIDNKRDLYRLIFNDWSYNSLCRKACKSILFDGRDYSPYYNIKHAEDLIQSLEILENSVKTVIIDKALYNYTINPKSITNTVNTEGFDLFFTPPEEAIRLIERDNVFNSDDFAVLYNNHLRMFISTIDLICYSDIKNKAKIEVFKIVKKHPYYIRLKRAYDIGMIKASKTKIGFFMFKNNLYMPYILYKKTIKFL